ncbi:MAG: transketolase [Desulfomonile tiedjei]|nr:transketolase [Desulfomonile tiedjei]
MRNAFAEELGRLAAEDPRIVLLSGDIGNRLFNDFKERFPDRFLNCGVAEANMIGVAAGMALSGLLPVTYTIASFNTVRCLEQIRVDVCYHNLPVIIVGVGAGLAYSEGGATHHSCEDIALLRALPNMSVVCPGDVWEVRGALKAAFDLGTPVYIRLGKKNEPVVHREMPQFSIGKGITIRPGNDVCLLSTGNMLPVVVEAAEELARAGVSAQVVSCHTVKPLDTALLAEAFAKFTTVLTVEEHSIIGGLGASVAQWLSSGPRRRARLCCVSTPDSFVHQAGSHQYMRERFGLTAAGIADKALKFHLGGEECECEDENRSCGIE